jgi:hypothetical protein
MYISSSMECEALPSPEGIDNVCFHTFTNRKENNALNALSQKMEAKMVSFRYKSLKKRMFCIF